MITNQVPGGSDRFEFSTVQFEGREKVICETVGRVSADAEDGYGETTIEYRPAPPNKGLSYTGARACGFAEDGYGEIESESTYPPMPALKFTDGREGSIRCICLKLVRRMALLIQNRHYSKRIRHKTDKTAFLGHSPRNYIVNIYLRIARARAYRNLLGICLICLMY